MPALSQPSASDDQSRDRKGTTGGIFAWSHGSLPYGRGSDYQIVEG
ncbi:MAG: hypothetical protein FWD61_16225 [Phycisphaerales bacterium]|nr:hypothetical protein [Phycisphaerales bacterium]